MEKAKNIFFLILGLAIFIWSFYIFWHKPAPSYHQPQQMLTTEKEKIILEIADTDEERTQGLSGRDSLRANHGMLFIFPTAGEYGFWMKEMHFPIDIIFLDSNLRVINVYQGVAPNTFPEVFSPVAPAKYVLEINSGSASRLGLTSGSKLGLDE